MGFERQAVRSTDLAIVGYDTQGAVVEVAFKSGSVYHYEGVPAEIYEGFMAASSHGKYFQEAIRERYKYRKIK